MVVFSHGLGCSRTSYSAICADLASHGYVVAAPEHREGSAAVSFHLEGGDRRWIPHRKVGAGKGGGDF